MLRKNEGRKEGFLGVEVGSVEGRDVVVVVAGSSDC